MRLRRRKPHRSPPGSAPGTLTVDPDAPKPEIEWFSFGPDSTPQDVVRRTIPSVDAIPPLPPGHAVCWINVNGLGDADILRRLGERYRLHPLVLEDIANVTQRPKVETYDDHLFIVTRIPLNSPGRGSNADPAAPGAAINHRETPWAVHAGELVTEQVSICVGRDFVITFQEFPGDVFDPVRHRLCSGRGTMRARGADYLAYALLDAAVDSYFPLLEVYGERVEDLEQDVVQQPEFGHIARIHDLKRNLLTARRAVWPQRELLNGLIREESPFVTRDTKIFLRDCYDHTIQLIDMIETYRDIASGLVDIQLSSISNRMNEVMKVLTIIATIFIPLTFIVGVYGMNFDTASPWNMPELHWRYGYPAVWLLMIAIAAGLVAWFRHKGWIGGDDTRRR